MKMPSTLAALLAIGLAGACATMPTPRNLAQVEYQPEQRLERTALPTMCAVPPLPAAMQGLTRRDDAALSGVSGLLAPGDRLVLTVSGDKDVLSGTYVVAANGTVTLGDDMIVMAQGRSREAVQDELRRLLIGRGLIRAIAGNVHLAQVESAGVSISVEGAVFDPGRVIAGDRSAEDRATTVDHPASGDFNAGRTLSSALRAAGGIRPDAAASGVYLIRGDSYAMVDLRPALGNGSFVDPQLATGDRIIVPSAGCFQPDLVRPSSVTAPGIRVYMSNLSRPAASNASSAIGKESTSLPYGTRLLQGLVSANCVGGSAMNAGRQAVLLSRNPIDRRSIVIARNVEAMVRNSNRDDYDPYLMPGDAIACYDSKSMALVDALGVVGGLVGPAVVLRGLKK